MSGRLFDEEERPPGRGGSREHPLTVAMLNGAADEVVRAGLGPVWIRAEVGRLTVPASGHWYFTLKDDEASVSAVMFRTRNRRLGFAVEEGMEVLALATAGVYAPRGQFQLVVDTLEPVGRGSALLAFEQLRRKLEAEGLLDSARRRPLPLLPERLGIVTSPTGAALRDVLRVLHRRHAGVRVLVFPARVQGAGAAEELVRGVRELDERGLDVILVVRGGGAYEDLAAFNDEGLARAIAGCGTPVVTGIGHEIDVTLADLAADLRAPTPSAAAEQVVAAAEDLARRLVGLRRRLAAASRARLARGRLALRDAEAVLARVPVRLATLSQRHDEALRRLTGRLFLYLARLRQRLARQASRLSPAHHRGRIALRRQRLEALRGRMGRAARARVLAARQRLVAHVGRLDALSPLAVLGRGYAIVTREDLWGPIVTDARAIAPGDTLHVRLALGAILARAHRILPPGTTEEP